MSIPASKALLTPCIGICRLGVDGLCEGCLRTSDEIARWMYMSEDERTRLMFDELPRRGAKGNDA
ncbi:MAG TPA: DUF1289 domain-containing protein [Rudaea sp.]|jgi:hypothetical protein|nr:DUF1289 domain-containing protein [Rudaea sp.]